MALNNRRCAMAQRIYSLVSSGVLSAQRAAATFIRVWVDRWTAGKGYGSREMAPQWPERAKLLLLPFGLLGRNRHHLHPPPIATRTTGDHDAILLCSTEMAEKERQEREREREQRNGVQLPAALCRSLQGRSKNSCSSR
ncbi:hypothetical protein GW17_00040536 [Ensete ventricosum]|nr:hypothetical protein GW17_00040536 [Ensete ventricosum]